MESASPTISSETDPLTRRFADWKSRGRGVLIPYITAGYPTLTVTADLLPALAAAGADIIELGVPFSDPVADGPTIQRASQRALEQGVTLADTLAVLREFRRDHDSCVIIFSYLNPILGYGIDRFLTEATDAGAEGVLLTDLPAGCDAALEQRFLDSPLSLIRLIAPTTSPERVAEIAAHAQGFLYYVARLGVTGARSALREETLREVAALRARVELPVAVGFGISTPSHARAVSRVADGVVVGSALIDALEGGGPDALTGLVADMRAAIDDNSP